MLYDIEDLMEYVNSVTKEVNGDWKPCRPLGYKSTPFWFRLKLALDVLRGKCDVVYWEQE